MSAWGQDRTADLPLFRTIVDYIIIPEGWRALRAYLYALLLSDSLYTFPARAGLGSGLSGSHLVSPEFTRFAIYFTAEWPEDSGGRSTTELPKRSSRLAYFNCFFTPSIQPII